MNLSLPERERLAYILDLPVAPLLAQMTDMDGSQYDSMRHEVEMLKEEIKELKATREDVELQDAYEELEYEHSEQAKQLALIAALSRPVSWRDD